MIKIDPKKKILIAFAGALLLIAGYLKYPVDALWSRDCTESDVDEGANRLQSESGTEENRKVRFISCSGIF